jgi:hypothetical protein
MSVKQIAFLSVLCSLMAGSLQAQAAMPLPESNLFSLKEVAQTQLIAAGEEHATPAEKAAEHKCAGEKAGEHKCGTGKKGEHKCASKKCSAKKCDKEHKCAGSKCAAKKCSEEHKHEGEAKKAE